MTVIEDFNELSHHLLEVMLNHLQNTKGPILGAGASSVSNKMGMGTPSFNNNFGSNSISSNFNIRQPSFKNEESGLNNKVNYNIFYWSILSYSHFHFHFHFLLNANRSLTYINNMEKITKQDYLSNKSYSILIRPELKCHCLSWEKSWMGYRMKDLFIPQSTNHII